MELTFSKYWKSILSDVELDGVEVNQVSPEHLEFIKKRAKGLYNKDVDVYDAFEELLELF